MADNLNKKIVNATKWSTITEVMGKLVAPISNMVLARLLTPDAFGVVATLHMVIAFAEIFTDAGFQRYLIQHEFKDEEDKDKSTNVAFWSNLVMSFVLWGIIAVFCEPLATLVGNPGLGHVLVVACVSIPLAAFSSIQMALYKRHFDFKTLFYRRLVSLLVPLVVTIPLAYYTRNYWALVIGTICSNIANAILLTVKSSWRPSFYYSFRRLKEMLSFCVWSIIDSILVWATKYIDVFLIGLYLTPFYLGLYKTSISTVGHFTSLITAIVLPLLLPAFSRLQNNIPELKSTILKYQKYLSVLLLPLGTGIFVFSHLITEIMLGSQWTEAEPMIGLWAIVDVFVVIFARFCGNVYPAIGKPRIAAVVQMIYLLILVPVVYYFAQKGFTELYWARSIVKFFMVLIHFVFIFFLIQMSPWKMLKNVFPEMFSCLVMAIVGTLLLRINDNVIWSLVWIGICIIVYFSVLYIFPKDRKILWSMVSHFKEHLLLKRKIK